MSQGRLGEAEKLYEQALGNDPGSREALQQLVTLHVAQKHSERAVRRVQAQIAKVPDNSAYYLLLGQALLQSQRAAEAQAALSKSSDLDRTNILASFLLAQSQESGGQIDAAASTYERTIRENPKDIRAYVAFGTLEERRGNWQSAQKLYQTALQLQPDQPAAANNLSYLLLEHGGDTDHALALAQIARRAMPDSPNTADTLAWAYYKKGIYKSAIDLLEEVTKKVPRNPTYHYHLGLAYEKSNKVAQARSTFQRALQIDPKSPHADEIHQALADLSTNP
jgi:tetratricopeptide (TPR) repeat protein